MIQYTRYATDGKGILADERKGQNRTGKNGGELSVVTSGKSGRIASNEMCTFLILNISSLQLIPVNMIAYRQQYGSVNPAGIIAPAIVATLISTLVAVVYCKMKDSRKRREWKPSAFMSLLYSCHCYICKCHWQYIKIKLGWNWKFNYIFKIIFWLEEWKWMLCKNSKMNFLKNVKIYLAKIMFIAIISINLLII